MFDPKRKTDPDEIRIHTTELPLVGWLRLKDIIGDYSVDPPVRPIVPVGKTSWLAGEKRGWYPPAHRFGRGVAFWSATDIRRLVETGDWRQPAKPGAVATSRTTNGEVV